MTGPRRTVVVLRPTVSGIDESAARTLVERVRERRDHHDVRLAFLDVASPSLHEVLDEAVADGVDDALLLPVSVPRDKYLTTWTKRGVANWVETRPGHVLNVTLHEPDQSLSEAVAARLVDALDEPGEPIRVSAASYRSPAWSAIDPHDRHVLICKGPRCMAYGAGPVHRELTAHSKATATKVTGTGCLSPCNLGPLAIVNPDGDWYGHLEPSDARSLVADGVITDTVTGKRLPR